MRKSITTGLLVLLCAGLLPAQLPTFKPGWNLFSKEQDIQLGREAAAQVEQQMRVVSDPRLNEYVRRIGQRLASQPQAGNFPYSFKVVADNSINAFALPGGPTFVHTGLLKAADNEAMIAGVLAHEISHVALRHGTHQASKANALQIPAALLGAVAGRNGSMMGQLAQLGVGLGANSLLLKYSRDAEKQADLLGAQIMASAGYNPIEMARLFEKLQAQGGSRTLQFLSDHPDPGNRVKYIEDEIRLLPRQNYMSDNGELGQIKQLVNNLPASATRPNGAVGGPNNAAPSSPRPSGKYREYRTNSYSISYPDNWQPFGDQSSSTVTIAPREGLVQTRGGGVQVGYGAMISYYMPPGDRIDLRRDTEDLIRQLSQSNPSMRVSREGMRNINIDSQAGLLTTLNSASPMQGEDEVDVLITIPRPEGLFYIVMIAPADEYRQAQGVFDSVARSIRFPR